MYHAFYWFGPDLQYSSSGGFGGGGTQPSYADLMIATDGAGKDRSYLSSEETFEHDVTDVRSLVLAVRAQAAELSERLRRRGLRASTVGVKVKLADFTAHGRQTTLSEPTDDARIIAAAAAFCVRRAGLKNARVRLVGTKVATLAAAGAKQISLFDRSGD